MKRKEVLEKMQTAIVTKYGTPKFPMSADELMDVLLQAAEDAGMLPPDRSSGCGDPQCCGGPMHEWDYEGK